MDILKIKSNLGKIKSDIKSANLIAVSKYSSVEEVKCAYRAGQYDFGENRVGDLMEKARSFESDHLDLVRWHFIGNLQSNKVKELLGVPNLKSIHSVSSLKLIEEIKKRIDSFTGEKLDLFLQLNTSHEEEKAGFDSLDELIETSDYLLSLNHPKLNFKGLMTMGAIRSEDFEASAHECFSALQKAKNRLQELHPGLGLSLSMGMSQDYKIALEYQSDYIRVGSAIFK